MTRLSDSIVDLLVCVAALGAGGGASIVGMIVADHIVRGSSVSINAGYAILGVGFLVFAVIGFFTVLGPYLYFRRKLRKRG